MKPALAKDISTIYQQALASGHAIAIFRLPHQKKINYISGNISRSISEGEAAFAFAPFDTAQKPYYITAAGAKVKPIYSYETIQKRTSKKRYKSLVKKIITEIKSGVFKKVVAARILAVTKPDTFNVVAFFHKLCSEYHTAFVSLTYIPGAGLWLGASPEILVSESTAKLTVYSLAGTKSINDDSEWNNKEINEQSIVTEFIRKKLFKLTGNKSLEKGPATYNAGTVKHLLTEFTITSQEKKIWQQVTKALHPTPAVAGLPQKSAERFIQKEEQFDRSFYAGYLGPVNQENGTNLYVNLRCMQVSDKQLLFYAGCGITGDSKPDEEWEESERKINVLKGLL